MQHSSAPADDITRRPADTTQGCDHAPSQEPWLQLLLIPLALATLLLFAVHGASQDERVGESKAPVAVLSKAG